MMRLSVMVLVHCMNKQGHKLDPNLFLFLPSNVLFFIFSFCILPF